MMLLIYPDIFQHKEEYIFLFSFICFCCISHMFPGISTRVIEGSVSGIPVTADSGKKRFLLLKGKDRGVSNVMFLFLFISSYFSDSSPSSAML